uniref:Ubiquitinyl hydrolase 1 n=1 Tax=Caenorhabditis japonica TaxID=281687 RepID=A0A8R1DIK5_CAEJA
MEGTKKPIRYTRVNTMGSVDQIHVDLIIVMKESVLVNFYNQRLKLDKENHSIDFLTPKDELRSYSIRRFKYKQFKAQAQSAHKTLLVSLEFDQSQEENVKAKLLLLKILFKPPNDGSANYASMALNEMMEVNRGAGDAKPNKSKMPPMVTPQASYKLGEADAYEKTSLINQKNIKKELDRRQEVASRSSSAASNIDINHKKEDIKSPRTSKVLKKEELVATSQLSSSSTSNVKLETAIEIKPKREKLATMTLSNPTQRRNLPDKQKTLDLMVNESDAFDLVDQENAQGSRMQEKVRPELKPFQFDDNLLPTTARAVSATPSQSSYEMDVARSLEFANRKLINIGNSCYFNASMQALSSCAPLVSKCLRLLRLLRHEPDLFKKERDSCHPNHSKFQSLFDFLVVINKLSKRKTTKTRVLPEPFKEYELNNIRRAFGSVYYHFDNSDQQDAHEYLITLLGMIDDLMITQAKRDLVDLTRTPTLFGVSCVVLNPMSVFSINVEIMYKCQFCNDEFVKNETRSDLSLTIEDGHSVQDLLRSYVKWSAIEKRCSKCDHTVSSVCDRLVKLPQCLIVNLKWYERDGRSLKKKKCSVKTSFDLNVAELANFSKLSAHPDLERSVLVEKNENETVPAGLSIDCDSTFNTRGSMLGGAKAECDDASSCEVIVEKVTMTELKFDLLDDYDQIQEMIGKLGIKVTQTNLTHHIKAHLKSTPKCAMEMLDKPGDVKRIEADGNCFYRSISWCLTGSQCYHQNIREKTANFVKENVAICRKTFGFKDDEFDSFLAELQKDSTWAGNEDIVAVSTMLNVEIYTFLKDRWTLIKPRIHPGFPTNFPLRTGAIYLENPGCHFEPVYSLKKMKMERLRSDRMSRKRKSRDSDGEQDGGEDDDGYRPKEKTRDTTQNARQRLDRSCKQTDGGKNKTASTLAIKYSLVAAVCHQGDSPDKGHYVAYTKDLFTDEWMFCSDDIVYPVSKDRVDRVLSNTGYVLFYTYVSGTL